MRALHVLEEWFTLEGHPQSQGLLKFTSLSEHFPYESLVFKNNLKQLNKNAKYMLIKIWNDKRLLTGKTGILVGNQRLLSTQ